MSNHVWIFILPKSEVSGTYLQVCSLSYNSVLIKKKRILKNKGFKMEAGSYHSNKGAFRIDPFITNHLFDFIF